MTVAVAGRRTTSSAYVPRESRAIASWSHTYGITDEDTPTPIPASSATGSANAGAASASPIGSATTAAISIASASPSIPRTRGLRATRCPSTMYSANNTALAAANPNPNGDATSRPSFSTYTPPAASSTATALRPVRVATAASAITGRNSTAATVPSGSLSIAR